MAEWVLMPQKGLTEEFAVLSKWLVKEGDKVKAGDYLFEIETGKAVFSVECETSGIILRTFGDEGDEIAISSVVCVIGQPDEKLDLDEKTGRSGRPKAKETKPVSLHSQAGSEKKVIEPMKTAVSIVTDHGAAGNSGGRIFASPIARRLAREANLDLAAIRGSGINGRIIRADVLAAREAAGSVLGQMTEVAASTDGTAVGLVDAGEFETVRHSSIRKVTARTMHASLTEMAQFTLHAQFDATALLALREKLKQHPAEHYRGITLNDLIIYGLSRTLTRFPALNAHYDDEKLTLFKHTHIGIAVDTDQGLLVPTLRDADTKTLVQISAEIRELAAACQTGRATPEMLSGGTFTATNLGARNIKAFTPVIAPPQTAILGIGSITYERRPNGQSQGGMEDYAAMNFSLTIDHRAVDGSPAARFLQALGWSLENYDYLLTLA